MAFPTVSFEIAFGTDPLATPTWTDVSAYVHSFEVVKGRQTVLDDFQPAECIVALSNIDRRFDPLHAGGPHFGNLKPFRRCRLRAVWNTVTYHLFDGYVDEDGFAQEYRAPNGSLCRLRMFDALGLLAMMQPEDPYSAAVRATAPFAWYSFDNDVASQIVDKVEARHGAWAEIPVYGDALNTAGKSVTVGAVDGVTYRGKTASLTPIAPYNYSIAFLFRADEAPPATHALIMEGTASPFVFVALTASVTGDGELRWTEWTTVLVSTGVNICDGRPHAIVVTRDGSTSVKVWIDGDLVMSDTPPAAAGGLYELVAGFGGYAHELDELVIWNSTISDAAAAAISGVTAWYGDTTGTRVGRILDLAGWPTGASWRAIETGESTMTGDLAGGSALDELNYCRRTEQGALYVRTDGTLTDHGVVHFRARSTPRTGTRHNTVQYTFTDKAAALSAGEYRYDTNSLAFAQAFARTEIKVGWSGGEETATSTAAFGVKRTESIDTGLRSAVEARAAAEWVLEKFKAPITEARTFTVNVAAAESYELLGVRIGDRVLVHREPQSVGTAIDFVGLVEEIRHQAGDGVAEWAMTVTLSAADTLPAGVGAWDEGLWDTAKWGW